MCLCVFIGKEEKELGGICCVEPAGGIYTRSHQSNLNLTSMEPLMWASPSSVQHKMPFHSLLVGGDRLVNIVAFFVFFFGSLVSHSFWEHGPQACGFSSGDVRPEPVFVPST